MIKPYIKNETAVDIICSICDRMYPGMDCEPADCEWMKMLTEESVDAAPVVHARWAHLGGDEWCCSACGFVITTEGSWDKPTKKYCEDCGARMDGGDNNAAD